MPKCRITWEKEITDSVRSALWLAGGKCSIMCVCNLCDNLYEYLHTIIYVCLCIYMHALFIMILIKEENNVKFQEMTVLIFIHPQLFSSF